jgi:hypothetical protein
MIDTTTIASTTTTAATITMSFELPELKSPSANAPDINCMVSRPFPLSVMRALLVDELRIHPR